MLAVTYHRLVRLVKPGRIFLLTVIDQVDMVREELPELPEENIFAEPAGRNTAPSLAVAAAMARIRGDDQPLLCCPSDHLIKDLDEFASVVRLAAETAAREDVLITFGITPDRAATGSGYIEAGAGYGDNTGNAEEKKIFSVKRFHEKPDYETAGKYLQKGGFFWNSGIFMWRPSVFLAAWERFLPEGVQPLLKIEQSLKNTGREKVIALEYPLMPAISVDCGILEKADNVVVIPADFEWNDVGSWDALYDILPDGKDGNKGLGEIESIDSSGNVFFNPGGTTAAIGVNDLIVAVKDGTVMICRRGDSQRVKELLEKIKSEGKEKLL